MEHVEGYNHQSGVHCGATALRNVSQYYGWNYTEAACFGIGGGPAFVLYEDPDKPWVTFRTSPTWLERAFFERLGVPNMFSEGDDFSSAWDNLTSRVDEDDPVILFLDPASLEYLPAEHSHLSPHVAVVVGYDDETVQLSDGAMDERQELSHELLAEAWSTDRFVSLSNEYLVVTRARTTIEDNDAAAAGLRQAATYMLHPLEIKRDARSPGEEGLSALRSFANYLGSWADLSDSSPPVRAALSSIDEHGEGAAFRSLFAESIEELGQRTDLAPHIANRMAKVGQRWQTVALSLEEILEADNPPERRLREVEGLVGDIADHEQDIFEEIADELGTSSEQYGE